MYLFLIGFVALGGVTSQSLMDLATTIIFLAFVVYCFKNKVTYKDLKPVGIEWAFISYFIIAIISLALNGKSPVPWFFYLSKFNWVVNLYLMIFAFNRSDYKFKNWFWFFSIAFLVPNIYALFTYYKGYDYLTQQAIRGSIGLVSSATYHAHGNSLIFVFFASLFVFLFNQFNRKQFFFFGLALTLMAASIFVSYTRGIWGATFVSLLVLSFIRSRKLGFLYLIITLVVGSTIYFNSEEIQHRLNASFATTSDLLRMELLQVHWQMFKAHPVIGIGFWESYRQIADYWPQLGLKPDHFESHSHNQYLNVLACTGIIGFIIFMSIMCYFVKCSWSSYKQFKKSDELKAAIAIAVFISILQFLLACLTDVSFEYAKIRGILVIGFALVLSLNYNLFNKKL
jgi:O-antigen ligase